jgi:hypothetical protein
MLRNGLCLVPDLPSDPFVDTKKARPLELRSAGGSLRPRMRSTATERVRSADPE